MKKGFIITLSGISGAGKSHFIKSIVDRFDNFEKLKAVTTRKKRKDEIEGVDKFFLSSEEFEKNDSNGEMCVVNNVFGNMYGYYKSDMDKIEQGKNLVTELYYKEVESFKKEYPNTISVYLLPKNISKTIEELKARNIAYEELNKRIADIKKEITFFKDSSSSFNLIVTNNYDKNSIEDFIKKVFLKVNEISNEEKCSFLIKNVSVKEDYRNIVAEFANKPSKKNLYIHHLMEMICIIYTIFVTMKLKEKIYH